MGKSNISSELRERKYRGDRVNSAEKDFKSFRDGVAKKLTDENKVTLGIGKDMKDVAAGLDRVLIRAGRLMRLVQTVGWVLIVAISMKRGKFPRRWFSRNTKESEWNAIEMSFHENRHLFKEATYRFIERDDIDWLTNFPLCTSFLSDEADGSRQPRSTIDI
jgi:hypothetical protein